MPLNINRITLLNVTQWLVLLIPIACALSRFASDVLLSLSAVLFLVHVVLTRRTDWLQSRWVQVALVLWVYSVLLSFNALDMEKAFGRSLSWLRFPVFAAALAFWVLEDAKTRARLIYALTFAVVFMLLDTALQYFTGFDILGWPSIPSAGSPRLTGPFSEPRVGIVLVWMTIPALAFWLMQQGGGARKGKPLMLGAFIGVGLLTVVFMSGERMALMLTGLAFTMAFFLLPVSKKLMLGIGLCGAIIMGLLAWTNPGLVQRQMDSTSQVVSDFSGSDYGQIWHSAWNIAMENPAFGVGLRQFREACPDAKYGAQDNIPQRCNLHPHNIYLEWLSESGFIGLALFVILIGSIWRDVFSRWRDLRMHALYLGLFITLFMRLWPLASSTSFFAAWSAVPLWLMIGWLLALCYHEKKPS